MFINGRGEREGLSREMDRFPFRDLFFRGTKRPTDRPTSVMTRESVIGLVFSAAAASFAARQPPPRHGHLLLITFLPLSFSTVHPLFRNQSQSLTGGPVGSPHRVPGCTGVATMMLLPYPPSILPMLCMWSQVNGSEEVGVGKQVSE